jgi:hypothetical protein
MSFLNGTRLPRRCSTNICVLPLSRAFCLVSGGGHSLRRLQWWGSPLRDFWASSALTAHPADGQTARTITCGSFISSGPRTSTLPPAKHAANERQPRHNFLFRVSATEAKSTPTPTAKALRPGPASTLRLTARLVLSRMALQPLSGEESCTFVSIWCKESSARFTS